MKTAAWLSTLFLASSLNYSYLANAETVDRPSAAQPTLPNYTPSNQPFILPPVLPSNTLALDLINTTRRVFIKQFHLIGNRLFSEQTLHAFVTPYENREVSISELENLRQQLSHYYTDAGYIDSGAEFVADSFHDGELTIRFIEGHIDEIRLQGLGRLQESYIAQRLLKNPQQPLNINELQENFQKLLTNPLIKQMNGRILPTNTLGHSILDITVTRAPTFHWSLLTNNYRPPSIGAQAFALNTQIDNLTGYGDSLDFSFVTSEGSNRYAGGFKVPLTASDTQAFFHFDEGDSSLIETPLSNLNITSQIHSLEGGLSQPLINQLQQKLIIGTLLAVREDETTLLNAPFPLVGTQAHNQVSVWRTFQDYSHNWQRHALALRSTFSLGINALGATRKTSNQLPSSEFFAWLGQGQYAYLVHQNSGTQAVVRGNAQFSDLPLLPLERLAVGGVNTVRGYRQNYLVRDAGYNVSVELHYPLLGGADSSAKVAQRLTLIPFVDYGQAWNHAENADTIYSLGIGFHWQYRFVQSELFYAHALSHPVAQQDTDIQDDGIHFQVKLADAF